MGRLPIRDKLSQRLVPFTLNPSQRKVHAALKAQHDKGRPMRAVVLKARRQGISTYFDNLLACHGIARSGTNAMIVTHDFKSSKELFKNPKTLLTDSLPGKKSLKSILNLQGMTQHKIIFPHVAGDSYLTIATAGNVEGGRGMSLTDLHCSEAAFYPGQGTFAALLPTVPRAEDTIIAVETTANGRTGIGEVFYEFWNASVRGDTEFAAIFLSWLIDPTCVDYDHPVPDAPKDDDERLLMKEGINIDGKLVKATPEQIAWRRMTIDSPACRGYVEIFDQEFPVTPDVAFISTGEPAFTREEMAIARNSIQPYKRVEIAGEATGGTSHIYCKPNDVSPVLQWEPPIKDHRYYFGVDAARGKDEGDFAAIVGVDGETGHQVLRYAQRVDPEYLARLCHYIGHYYNKGMLCIELTGNLGLWCQMRLRDYFHYPNLYRWRGTRDDKIAPGLTAGKRGGSYGWETTYRSRERLLITYRESILHRMITIRDEEVVRQMDVATRKDSWERWEIAYGHDDILMATMLANIARSEWHPRKVEGVTSALSTDADKDSRALQRLNPQPSFEHLGSVTASVYHQLVREKERWDREDDQRKRGLI
ncbi:hypothetical protein J2P12_01010 [Candidatus Bathyarchaeota archaeon]|nr:hypothetical protein [Candidatus Bathyarchaeota archaeon]